MCLLSANHNLLPANERITLKYRKILKDSIPFIKQKEFFVVCIISIKTTYKYEAKVIITNASLSTQMCSIRQLKRSKIIQRITMYKHLVLQRKFIICMLVYMDDSNVCRVCSLGWLYMFLVRINTGCFYFWDLIKRLLYFWFIIILCR